MDIKDRILEFMEVSGITPSIFAERIGVQPSAISHIISGRNKPSFDFLVKIMQAYPNINSKWLITGYGNIFTSSDKEITKEETTLIKERIIPAVSKEVDYIMVFYSDKTFDTFKK